MRTVDIKSIESIENGRRYSTLPEAIKGEIIDPLESGGGVEDAAQEYDLDMMADLLLVTVTNEDEDGIQHGNIFYTIDPDINDPFTPSVEFEAVARDAEL